VFSDKERESWQNIKAPTSLLEKCAKGLDEAPVTKKTGFKKMLMPLVAACFAVVIAVVFMMSGGSDTRIFIGETELLSNTVTLPLASEPMMLSRTAESSIVLTLDIEDEAEISTADGYFSLIEVGNANADNLTSYKTTGKALVRWTYPVPNDKDSVSLNVKTGKELQTVKVLHDAETGLKNVTLIKNK